MGNCKVLHFPQNPARWVIAIDQTMDTSCECFRGSDGAPTIRILGSSVDSLPELVEEGKRLLKIQSAVCHT